MTIKNLYYTGDGTFWITSNGKHKNPDFKYSHSDKVIEVFGDYWHTLEEVDKLKLMYLKEGYDCLIIWEHEMKIMSDEQLKQVILQFVSKTNANKS